MFLIVCTGINFINIIRTNVLYERHFSSYILALLKNSYEKRARITLMKLTTGSSLMRNKMVALSCCWFYIFKPLASVILSKYC